MEISFIHTFFLNLLIILKYNLFNFLWILWMSLETVEFFSLRSTLGMFFTVAPVSLCDQSSFTCKCFFLCDSVVFCMFHIKLPGMGTGHWAPVDGRKLQVCWCAFSRGEDSLRAPSRADSWFYDLSLWCSRGRKGHPSRDSGEFPAEEMLPKSMCSDSPLVLQQNTPSMLVTNTSKVTPCSKVLLLLSTHQCFCKGTRLQMSPT